MKPDVVARVRKYLVERAKTRTIDFERIHDLHTGDEKREANLTVTDLKALCDRVEALEAALREQLRWLPQDSRAARLLRDALEGP